MTGLAANSKSGPNVKLEDNAEQLPSAYIDKEKLPEKGWDGDGDGEGGCGGEKGGGGAGLEEQTALKKRPEPFGSRMHWPLGNPLDPSNWLH